MTRRQGSARGLPARRSDRDALVHALKTHQVDAIVGERHVMVVRLRHVEEALESSRDELRALAARLQFEREDERSVIAREIHDELGQTLTSLQLGLAWIARAATPGQRPLQAKIKSLATLVTTTIQSVRRIAVELRPGALDELGLTKTLRLEAQGFAGHTGIRCTFETNLGKTRCARAGGVAIYRIAQAALTNVARHAQATRASMTLMMQGADLVLTVHDNGRGVLRTPRHRQGALGIVGMRERAIALEGRLTLRGSTGKGTTLTVRIPSSRVLLSPSVARPAGRRASRGARR